MKKALLASMALACVFFAGHASNAGGKKQSKFVPKCVVSGRPINKEAFLSFNGAKVYFCCPNCPKAFAKKKGKFASKANQQIVGTNQAKQKACPFTGRPLNPATKISVGGVNVCFCCFNCQGKAKRAKGAKQLNMIFNNRAFKKGFSVKKAN